MDFTVLASTIFYASCLCLRTLFTTSLAVPCQDIDFSHHHNSVHSTCDGAFQKVVYSKQDLYSLRPEVTKCVLSPRVLTTLRTYNINLIKKTRRSRRGGQKQIKPITTPRDCPNRPPCSNKTINLNNFIQIDLQDVIIDNSKTLNFMYLNARSCRNKALEINDIIIEKNADLLFISETWLGQNDCAITNEILPEGYDILSRPRLSRSGGGFSRTYHNGRPMSNMGLGLLLM